jgi:flagellar assembly factor FliW
MSAFMESEMEVSDTQSMEFPRFGSCTFAANDVIEFPWGIPGFPNLRRWLALSTEEGGSYVWLQCIDDVKIALPTIDPYFVFEDYAPKLPAYASAALEIESPADFTILCVVVVSENAEEMTMNLFAPVVINLRTRRGRQIVLENSGYSVRHAIPRKATADSTTKP